MIKLKNLLKEGFSKSEQEKITDMVKKCFREKGNNGVRDYNTLNKYLGKLPFEVDADDIEIHGWVASTFDRSIKSAEVSLQGKYLTSLQN